MPTDNTAPLWASALSWFNSTAEWIFQHSAIARDSKLRMFESKLDWTDGEYAVEVSHNWVLAHDESEARRLANERAAKDEPLITPTFDNVEITPAHMTDPKGTLARWAITEKPIGRDFKALVKKGELESPRASETNLVLGKIAPGTTAFS